MLEMTGTPSLRIGRPGELCVEMIYLHLSTSTGLVFVLPIYLHAHLLGLQPIPALMDGSFIGKETVQDTAASALPL